MGLSFHVVTVLLLLALHYATYVFVTNRRRADFVSGAPIVGVDIDGVLNDHRTHFAPILNERVNKVIDPLKITSIPVHEMPGAGLTTEDEHAVFNWPGYWSEMPIIKDAPEIMRKLRALGYRISILRTGPGPRLGNLRTTLKESIIGRRGEKFLCWQDHSIGAF